MLLEQTIINSFINKEESKTVDKITLLIISFINKEESKTVYKKALLSTIPMDTMFVVEHFLSFKCASRLVSTSRNMNRMVSNDELAKIWFKTMISTNCPSLLCISHPLLTSSKQKLQAYSRCRQIGTNAEPDVSHALVDVQLFRYKNNTPENGNTITCRNHHNCTLVNTYGRSTCAACSRKIDYIGTGDTVTLFRTTSKINGDGTFAYPPIDETTAKQIESSFDGEDEGMSPLFLRACLFDPKTNKTFAAYEAGVNDSPFDDECLEFEWVDIQYAPIQPHFQVLVEKLEPYMVVHFNWDGLRKIFGSTAGQVHIVFLGSESHNDLQTVVAPLYVFSRSVVAQTPALLMPKKGQLPFVSQSALIAAGRDALFDLPPPPRSAHEYDKIAAAKISLATMLKDTVFVVSVSRVNSPSVIYHKKLDHKKLVATYSNRSGHNPGSSLQFVMPGFDAVLKATFDSEEWGQRHFQLQLLAISSSRNTICQLMESEFKLEVSEPSYWSMCVSRSASEDRAEKSLVGSVLVHMYEEDEQIYCQGSYIKTDTLSFSVSNLYSGDTFPPHYFNAYLQMCLLDGSVDMVECE